MGLNFDDIFKKISETNIGIKKRILLIDGHNTFMRAMSMQNIVNDNGVHIGGLSGFLLSIGSTLKKLKPIHEIVIVFDGKDTIKSRREIYENYKLKKKDISRFGFYNVKQEQNAIKFQMERLFKYFEFLPVRVIIADYAEADDVIGYMASNYKDFFEDVNQIYIMSTDKDYKQNLVKNDDIEISIFEPSKKIIIDKDTFKTQYNMIPENYTLLKCFIRDDGDNIPGVYGIGEKTFAKLFPFVLNTDTVFDISSFFDVITHDDIYTKSKSKKIQSVLQQQDLLNIFYKLVDLRNNSLKNITSDMIGDIKMILKKPVPITNKYSILQLATQDGVINFIKNPIKWVEQVFI